MLLIVFSPMQLLALTIALGLGGFITFFTIHVFIETFDSTRHPLLHLVSLIASFGVSIGEIFDFIGHIFFFFNVLLDSLWHQQLKDVWPVVGYRMMDIKPEYDYIPPRYESRLYRHRRNSSLETVDAALPTTPPQTPPAATVKVVESPTVQTRKGYFDAAGPSRKLKQD